MIEPMRRVNHRLSKADATIVPRAVSSDSAEQADR
jgi:hypothetical protein